jgi:hypothetical protein
VFIFKRLSEDVLLLRRIPVVEAVASVLILIIPGLVSFLEEGPSSASGWLGLGQMTIGILIILLLPFRSCLLDKQNNTIVLKKRTALGKEEQTYDRPLDQVTALGVEPWSGFSWYRFIWFRFSNAGLVYLVFKDFKTLPILLRTPIAEADTYARKIASFLGLEQKVEWI